MTYKDEFLKQWNNFTSIIRSEIKKRLNDNSSCSSSDLNKILFSERDKWFSEYQYQGAWLRKLKRHNKDIADSFEWTLGEIKFGDINIPPDTSFMPYALASAGVGAGGFILTSTLKLAAWQILGTTILLPAVTGKVLHTVWKDKNQQNKTACGDFYINQLEQFKLELVKLCEEADMA